MTRARRTIGAAIAVAASAALVPAMRAKGEDVAALAPFSVRIGDHGVEVRRVACGADGSVYAAGLAAQPDVIGGVDLPPPDRRNVDPYFLTAFAPDGSVRWTRYLQLLYGENWYPTAQVGGVAVAPDGSIWIAGGGVVPPVGADPATYRTDRFDGDAWVAKFASDGTPLFAENVGGTGSDFATAIVVLPDGDAVVVGETKSADFPVVGAAQPFFGGGEADGFAFRMRADGSGVVWATYLGGQRYDDVTAAAAEPAGSVVVATRTGASDARSYADFDGVRTWIDSVGVTRITGSGEIAGSAALPHGPSGGVLALAVGADGRVFAGGVSRFKAYWDSAPDQGFVVRLAAEPLAIEALWRADPGLVTRIAVGPEGEVLAAGRRGPVVEIAPDFLSSTRLAWATPAGVVEDVAYCADGSVCLVGNGLGSPLPDAEVRAGAYVARLGVTDFRAPRRFRVSRVEQRRVELSWSAAGPDVVAFEVETGPHASSSSYQYEQDDLFTRTLRLPADRRRAAIVGLRSAGSYAFRVTAVHASGVRMPTHAIHVITPPEAVRGLEVTPLPDGRVEITWNAVENDEAVAYRLERKSRDAPWASEDASFRYVRPDGWELYTRNGRGRTIDRNPPPGELTYRIRAGVGWPPTPGPWTFAVLPAASR